MISACNRFDQSPAVSERRKATTGFMLDCCTPGRRGFQIGATVKVIIKCSVSGCDRRSDSKGLCASHYQRLRNFGNVMPDKPFTKSRFGSENPHWKGGQTHDGDGRIYLYRPEHPNANAWGYVYRYRLVAEEHLGRFLTSSEIVHHRNGIESDDRWENLIVTTQSKHINIDRHKLQTAAWWRQLMLRPKNEKGQFK